MRTEHWLDAPQNVKKLWRGFLVVLALTVLAGFVVDLHPHFGIEQWPGFNTAFGFISCLLMIVGAKALGVFLKRSDRYYAKELNNEAHDE